MSIMLAMGRACLLLHRMQNAPYFKVNQQRKRVFSFSKQLNLLSHTHNLEHKCATNAEFRGEENFGLRKI